jgi:hypothetical protein
VAGDEVKTHQDEENALEDREKDSRDAEQDEPPSERKLQGTPKGHLKIPDLAPPKRFAKASA